MATARDWMLAARPKTLPAAVTPVLLGTALASADGAFVAPAAGLCLAFALFMQVGVNMANDYLDGARGADAAERLGPTRMVASGRIAPAAMRRAALGVLAAGFALGLGLIPFGGWWLLAVGIASVLSAWGYTGGPYPLAYHGLGDVFVVLFFGCVATGVTYYTQAGEFPARALALGLGCGLLTNNILVVNNYRDAEADRAAGKLTLVARAGRRFARGLYAVSGAAAAGAMLYLAGSGYGLGLAPAAALALASIALVPRLARAASAADYGRLLAASSGLVAGYGILGAAGLLL